MGYKLIKCAHHLAHLFVPSVQKLVSFDTVKKIENALFHSYLERIREMVTFAFEKAAKNWHECVHTARVILSHKLLQI